MMQECPRCKFVQPQDRYCANCGLDIENYVPLPESFFSKLSKNTKLHVTLVILIVIALGLVVYITQRERLAQQMQNAPTKITDYRLPKKNQNPAGTPGSEQQEAAPVATPQASTNNASAEAVPAGVSPAAATEPPGENASEFTFTFAEVPKTLLQQLMAEGQTLSEGPQSHSFTHTLISDIAALREKDPDFHVLPGGQTTKVKQGVPFSLDFTHNDPTTETELGLNIDGLPHKTRLKNIELELDGQVRIKTANAQSVSSQDIQANFTFASGNTLILVLMLPRQDLSDDLAEPFSNTPLAILDSPQFISGSSELAIFIHAK